MSSTHGLALLRDFLHNVLFLMLLGCVASEGRHDKRIREVQNSSPPRGFAVPQIQDGQWKWIGDRIQLMLNNTTNVYEVQWARVRKDETKECKKSHVHGPYFFFSCVILFMIDMRSATFSSRYYPRDASIRLSCFHVSLLQAPSKAPASHLLLSCCICRLVNVRV